MRWGIRSQVLLTLAVVLAFGLLASHVATSRLTREALLKARVNEVVGMAGLAAQQLGAHEGPEARTDNLARLRTHLAPDLLYLLGRDLRPIHADPEELVRFSQHVFPSDLVELHVGEPTHRTIMDRQGEPLLIVFYPVADPEISAMAVFAPLHGTLKHLDNITALYLTFALVILAMATILGYVFLGRTVVVPVARLVRVIDRIGGGQFSGEEEAPGSSQEMRQLFGSVHRMSDQLDEDRLKIQRQVTALELANRDLASAQERLVRTEKLASVGELAAGVAHEIGNPIATVQGYVDMMESGPLPPEEHRPTVQAMQGAIGRVSTIIRDLLDFARPVPPSDGDVMHDATHAIRASLKLVEPQKRFRGMKVEQDIPERSLAVGMAEGRLEQVLVNLLLNAADACEGQGLIQLTVTVDEGEMIVEVSDDGVGISPDHLRRIFDPFFSTKEPGAGTGLGLAVCHGIIESAGGHLSVESEEGVGSTFRIVLPLVTV